MNGGVYRSPRPSNFYDTDSDIWSRQGDCPRSVTVRCPWGNAFHVLESAAGAGIQGVHFDCAKGESGLVARHFQRLFGAAVVTEDGVAKGGLGASSFFAFQETGSLPAGFPKSLDHLHVRCRARVQARGAEGGLTGGGDN